MNFRVTLCYTLSKWNGAPPMAFNQALHCYYINWLGTAYCHFYIMFFLSNTFFINPSLYCLDLSFTAWDILWFVHKMEIVMILIYFHKFCEMLNILLMVNDIIDWYNLIVQTSAFKFTHILPTRLLIDLQQIILQTCLELWTNDRRNVRMYGEWYLSFECC